MSAPSNREEEIFETALNLPEGDRAKYVDNACGGDADLHERVMKLVKAHAAAGNFMHEPAVAGRKTIVVSLPVDEKPGDKIGRYKLLQQIGEGGCGVVYMAEQEEPVRRRVALKVIKLGMDTKSVIARFEAERQALAMMDHPNIAKVLDAGATETGRPFFVMELVRGIKITDYCDQNKLSTTDRLALFIQVCNAIQHAHQKGIIHRDIKPSNILVTLHDGVPVPKVIDFGIAKATQGRLTDQTLFTAFEQFIGTPAYMSPEQAEMSGLDIDTRSDIYALGVLLYELLTGGPPFDPKELLQAGLDELRRTIREKEPPKPSTRLSTMLDADLTAVAQRRQSDAPKLVHLLRGDLDWIVIKSLEKDRTRRYETANGMAMDIQRYLTNEPIVARPPSTLYRFQKLVRRNRTMFAAISIGTAALVLGLILSSYLYIQERELREMAERIAAANREVARAGLLLMQAKYDDSEAIISKIPPHDSLVPFYNVFGGAHARRQEWLLALTNWEMVVQYAPDDHIGYQYLAPLLLQLNNVDGYKACRAQILREFGNTTDPRTAERMVKASLILPASDDEMKIIFKMAEVALGGDTNSDKYGFNLFAKGFAQYRMGYYVRAQNTMRQIIPMDVGDYCRAEAYLVLAMALFHEGRLNDSRDSLAKAEEKLKEINREDGVDSEEWNDWITIHVLMREATALIRGDESEAEPTADGSTAVPETPAWQTALDKAGFKFTVEQQADGTWQLNLKNQRITDLTPLRGASISWLSLENAPISDIEPLRGMPLQNLDLVSTGVVDLSPLAGMKLKQLSIAHTSVADIAPLRGMPLLDLSMTGCTNITDLTPLKGMTTLQSIILPPTAKNFEFLRDDTNLERISFKFQHSKGPSQTADEFWAEQDKATASKP